MNGIPSEADENSEHKKDKDQRSVRMVMIFDLWSKPYGIEIELESFSFSFHLRVSQRIEFDRLQLFQWEHIDDLLEYYECIQEHI